MSIKKLAKSINNLADAIRYHANMSGSNLPSIDDIHNAGDTFTTNDRIESEGFKAPSKFGEAVAEAKIRERTTGGVTGAGFSYKNPQPLTEAEQNFVDPYDTPPPKTPHLAAERDETLMVDPAPVPTEKPELSQEKPDQVPMSNAQLIFKKDAPGWQALTVEELDAAPSTPSVEVDADGLPWDERIHSGGKTLLVDGTWRLKRGVPDDEYQEVVAELKKLMAIPAPDTVTATLNPTKPVELSEPVDNTPPPPPNASVPVPPAPSVTVDNLPAFIKAVTGAQLDKDVVLAAVKNAGLENVMQLGARPDLIAGIAKELGL